MRDGSYHIGTEKHSLGKELKFYHIGTEKHIGETEKLMGDGSYHIGTEKDSLWKEKSIER
jgi:hypothetical protein